MLDLDAIASRRAETLNQDHAAWRTAVWSASFQELSARLSDGEVEELLGLCTSPGALGRLTRILEDRAVERGVTPLDWLKNEANGRALSPAAWVERFARGEEQ